MKAHTAALLVYFTVDVNDEIVEASRVRRRQLRERVEKESLHTIY